MGRVRTGVASLALLALLALAACKRAAPAPAPAPAPDAAAPDASPPPVDASAPDAATTALAPLAPLAPLAWGTRPPAGDLELYPALDGPCTVTVSPLIDTTAVIVGASAVLLATADGFDLREPRFPKVKTEDELPSGMGEAGGRKDALWVEEVFMPSVAKVHVRRAGEGWKGVAPLGSGDDSRYYVAPEPYRGGALGLVRDHGDFTRDVWHRLVGYDLPKDVVVAKLLPANVVVRKLWALAEGDLVVVGASPNGVTQPVFVLPASGDGGAAQKIDASLVRSTDLTLEGRTRASFRVVTGDKRFRLEGQALVREEIESAPEWRIHGNVVQHLVGAGYREAPLPKLPITGAVAEPTDVYVAFDGEVFVKARTGNDENRHDALFRSRKPREVLRCTEVGVDREGNTERGPEGFGPATLSGVEPWPPPADTSCATPFVVARRWREKHTVPADMPVLRAALAKAGHDVTLEDVPSGTRRVVGARAKDLEKAKAIAKTITKVLGEAPEIVCADPGPGRILGADAGAR